MSQPAHELFLELLDLEASERARLLAARCVGPGGEDLRADVEALLAADVDAAGFLEPPALDREGGGSLTGLWLEGRRIGQYEITRRVGLGGMSSVYEAIQARPRRRVALKLLRVGLGTRELCRRFELEAEILGRLQHPGIAEIYEAGTHDSELGPIPFFALEFVAGARTLTEWAEHSGADLRARVALIASVCDAVDHAHRHGVVHRDLKPSNVLVGDDGRARLIDFGVARALDEGLRAATLRTQVGELVGTLQYMSPEQCAAEGEIDARSDVYSLGVVLYELVAGRLPYPMHGAPAAVIAALVRHHEPRGPTRGRVDGWRQLDAIVLTALEKSPALRYESAAELAADLRRALAGEPVQAARSRRSFVLRKLTWRGRRALPAAAALACVGLAAATLLRPDDVSPPAQADRSERGRASAATTTYAHRITLAERAVLAHDLARAKAMLAQCPPEQRRWEWHRLRAVVDQSTSALELGAPVIALAKDDRDELVAVTTDGRAHALAQLPGTQPPQWTARRSVALDRDPTSLAIAGGVAFVAGDRARVRAWHYRDGATDETGFAAGHSPIWGLAIAGPDELAISRRDGTLELWARTVPALRRSIDIGSRLGAVAVHAGELIVAMPTQGVTVRSLGDGSERRRLSTSDEVEALLVDDHGIYTAGWQNRIRVFGEHGDAPQRELDELDDGIVDLARIDESTIASAGRDGEVVVWDVPGGAVLRRLRGHDLGVEALVVDEDGWLASASLDGSIRTWDLHAPPIDLVTADAGEKVHALAWADPGRVLIGGTGMEWDRSGEHRVVAWSAGDGRELAAALDHRATVDAVVVSPDFHTLATADRDGVVVLRDPEGLAPRMRIDAHVGRVAALAFAVNGEQLASAGVDGTIAIWRVDDGSLLARTDAAAGALAAVAWPDDIVAAGALGVVRWPIAAPATTAIAVDLADFRALAPLADGDVVVGTARGELARIGPHDGLVRWRMPTFGRAVTDIAIAPDGDRLAVASQDYRVRLHDVATGELVLTVGQHETVATAVAFAPDSSALASAGFDRRARIWRAPNGR